MNKSVTLALDVMSGEKDPQASVQAAIDLLSIKPSINLHLIGNQEEVQKYLPQKKDDRLTLHHTDEIITMQDSPMDVLRRKKQSSMRLAVEMVANKTADACVSSGNTGALLAISKYHECMHIKPDITNITISPQGSLSAELFQRIALSAVLW